VPVFRKGDPGLERGDDLVEEGVQAVEHFLLVESAPGGQVTADPLDPSSGDRIAALVEDLRQRLHAVEN